MKKLIEKEINSVLSNLEHIMLTSENIQDSDFTTYHQLIWTKQDIHKSILTIKDAIQSLTQEPSATNNKSTEQIKADFYQGLNMVRDKIQRHKTALLLMINSFEKAIELKSQEPSAVSAEELRKDFGKAMDLIMPHINGHKTAVELLINTFNKAMQEYSNASKRDNQWISVEDMLPAMLVNVLVLYKHHSGQSYTTRGYLSSKDKFSIMNFAGSEIVDISKITHWMPLPQLP